MFSLNTTATLQHTTVLPPGTSFTHAVSLLHNHDLLIRLDPEFSSYETLPPSPSSPNAKRYKITDHMRALPKGLWDSSVTFENEMMDTDDGVSFVIRAPLGLLQTTNWRVVRTAELDGVGQEGDEGGDVGREGEWTLVESTEIRANRLLVGTVRGKCEENWRGSHARFVEQLVGGVKEVGDERH